jgi:SAM-dependent methyltransferase
MSRRKTSHFDQAAPTWDDNPSRIALMKAVGEAILRQVQPTAEMDVLDYGCGTGLVGLFLLPHVGSVTGADNSAGMLDMLRKKIEGGGLGNMRAVRAPVRSTSSLCTTPPWTYAASWPVESLGFTAGDASLPTGTTEKTLRAELRNHCL